MDSPSPFALFLVDLTAVPNEKEVAGLSILESIRAAKFKFAQDRQRYISAHCSARKILATHTGQQPGELVFAEGPFGKPYLVGPISCSFNISHSDDLALIVIADNGEIGVDIEMLKPLQDEMILARRNFTPAEFSAYVKTSHEERNLAFFTAWTRKEACLKAIGSGLTISPDTMETGMNPGSSVVRATTPDGPKSVEVVSFVHSCGFVGSIAHISDN